MPLDCIYMNIYPNKIMYCTIYLTLLFMIHKNSKAFIANNTKTKPKTKAEGCRNGI